MLPNYFPLLPSLVFDDIILFGPYVKGLPLQRLWCPDHLRGKRQLNSEEEVIKIYNELVSEGGLFRDDALNEYNEWFYHHKYSPEVEVIHNTFTENREVVQAIGNCLCFGSSRNLAVKVIMAGSSSQHAFIQIAQEHLDTQFTVELSDFFAVILDNQTSNSNLFVSTQEENILSGLAAVANDKRFDVMLCTYGFDSVWMRGDRHYIFTQGNWYQSLHRLKHVEDNSGDYGSPFIIETIIRQVADILAEPYGKYISKLYNGYSEISINVPAGLISTVQAAFKYQLHQRGMFVVGDICAGLGESVREYEFLESGASYKIEDYRIAVKVLERMGYGCELLSLSDFLAKYGKREEKNTIFGKYILVVRQSS